MKLSARLWLWKWVLFAWEFKKSFRINGLALSLALKQRLEVTGKWPILSVSKRVFKDIIDLICLIVSWVWQTELHYPGERNCPSDGVYREALQEGVCFSGFRYKTGIWERFMSWLLYKRVGTSVLDQEEEWGHHPAIRKVNIFQLSCTETGGNKKVTDFLCEQIGVKNLVYYLHNMMILYLHNILHNLCCSFPNLKEVLDSKVSLKE